MLWHGSTRKFNLADTNAACPASSLARAAACREQHWRHAAWRDDLHSFEGVGLVFEPLCHRVEFVAAPGVSRVGDHGEDTAGPQAPGCLFHCPYCRCGTGDPLLVSPGQVAEIEHDGCYLPLAFGREPLQQMLVAAELKRDPFQQAVPAESPARLVDRCLLDVEGVDPAGFAHQPGQFEGVMAITRRGIHHFVAHARDRGHLLMREVGEASAVSHSE